MGNCVLYDHDGGLNDVISVILFWSPLLNRKIQDSAARAPRRRSTRARRCMASAGGTPRPVAPSRGSSSPAARTSVVSQICVGTGSFCNTPVFASLCQSGLYAHISTTHVYTRCVDFLLYYGANVDVKTRYDSTLLHRAETHSSNVLIYC